MRTWKKITLGVGAVLVLAAAVGLVVQRVNRGVVKVQTAQVIREDLTQLVTASGEIKPRNYTNVMAEGFGKITDIDVNEGDRDFGREQRVSSVRRRSFYERTPG